MASRFGDEYRKWHDGMSPLAPMLPFGDTTKSWSNLTPDVHEYMYENNLPPFRDLVKDAWRDRRDGDDGGKKWRPEGGSKVPRKPKGPAPASPARKKMESV